MVTKAQFAACFIVSIAASLLGSEGARAEVNGFQDRYFAEVDGSTWILQLAPNKTFQSLVTAKLQMGDTRDRYLLMGGLSGNQISGSYKPILGTTATFDGERRFEIKRLSENSLRLSLKDESGKTGQQFDFTSNAAQAPIDSAIIGTWLTIAEPEGNLDKPYSGEQWAVRFMEDGTLCEDSYTVDTRKPQVEQDPCLNAQARRWKAVDGKIYIADSEENWALQFNYRLMGGRMVVSYPGGKRRVANIADGLRLSADSR
jgi:hypothetical protein